MDLLEKTLTICFATSNNLFLINTDTFSQPIAKQIMGVRLSQSPLNSDPIVLYGLRSLDQVLRSEKEHARLILGPRIYHLQLPAGLDDVHRLSRRVERESVDEDRFLTEFKESSFADAGLSRMESAIAHGRGNFLGCEKLLYGAYLAGAVDAEGFRKRLTEIRAVQESAFSLDSTDYQHYRLLQVDYEPKGYLAQTPFEPFQGDILHIDDHAHLGWSTAIATALWGNYTEEASREYSSESIDIYSAAGGEGRLYAFRKKVIEDNEDSYLDRVLGLVREHVDILKSFDVILLDLRLRYTEDEMSGDRDIKNLSGIQVLSEIRKTLPGIPIVILTASRKAKNMQKVLALGADHYFIKEIPRPQEKPEDVFRYWQKFRETLDRASSRSFLSIAWDLIGDVQRQEPSTYLNGHIEYQNLPREARVDWDQDVVLPIIKGLGFVRLDPNPFEKELYVLDPVSEAIMNFNLPNDVIFLRNKEYHLLHGPRLYFYTRPYWSPETLLFGLRSLGVHGTGEALDFEDVKIALYLCFRLFLKPDILEDLAVKMFGKTTITLDRLNYALFEAVNAPIISELGIDREPSINVLGRYKIERKKGSVSISFPKKATKGMDTGSDTSKLPHLPLTILMPAAQSPVFDLLKSRKDFHYRMFLGRLHYFKEHIQGADWNLVSAIYRRVFTE